MARIRTIKPDFFTSEDIVALSPLARLLYIAIWCEADKEGRLIWKPNTFKLRYLPGDNCNVHALCDEITGRGLVKLYGDGLAVIPAFAAHQHINPRESESVLPAPDDHPRAATRTEPVNDCTARVDDASARVDDAQGGREGKGKEGDIGKERKKNTSACARPPDGVPDPVWADFQKLRRAKKAPITETAIDGIRREADRAGMPLGDALAMCCERGWTGFKADWLEQKSQQRSGANAPNALSFAERDELAKRRRWEEMTGRQWPADDPIAGGMRRAVETIDVQAMEVRQ